MVEAVDKLTKDPEYFLEIQTKDPTKALRCYPRKPEDGRIAWHHTALDILRLVNATNKPYTGAFCEYEGEKMVIWTASIVCDDEVFCAVPGQVTKIGNGFIEVACGEGKLRLSEIEIAEKVMTPDKIIRSIRKRLL